MLQVTFKKIANKSSKYIKYRYKPYIIIDNNQTKNLISSQKNKYDF